MVHLRQIQSRALYDLVFIGSGLSSTCALIETLEQLRRRCGGGRPPHVLVLERAGDAYGGLAYGRRAGGTALLTTNFRDFLPSPERERFLAWLTTQGESAFDDFEAAGGDLARDWLRRNRPHMQAGRWDRLHLPRYLFGRFLSRCAEEAIVAAAKRGVATCSIARADVVDTRAIAGGFEVDAVSGDTRTTLRARSVVLAVGSPPNRPFAEGQRRIRREVCVIDDLYAPGLGQNLQRARRRLALVAASERAVLIIGGNAAALEAIYNLAGFNGSDAGTRFRILSPAGRLPERIDENGRRRPFVPEAIDALSREDAVSAAKIYQAVLSDVRAARARRLTVASTFEPITRSIAKLFERLSHVERERFCCRYGVEIGRLQRRAGGEYCDAVERLRRENRIEHIRGHWSGGLSLNGHGLEFSYRAGSEGGGSRTTAAGAAVVINCTGPQRLSATSSPLLRNLMRRGLCAANPSDRGFRVNDRLEASSRFHVIGPLLAGNIIAGNMVWHVEHCGRIIQFGKRLAVTLADDLESPKPPPAEPRP